MKKLRSKINNKKNITEPYASEKNHHKSDRYLKSTVGILSPLCRPQHPTMDTERPHYKFVETTNLYFPF